MKTRYVGGDMGKRVGESSQRRGGGDLTGYSIHLAVIPDRVSFSLSGHYGLLGEHTSRLRHYQFLHTNLRSQFLDRRAESCCAGPVDY